MKGTYSKVQRIKPLLFIILIMIAGLLFIVLGYGEYKGGGCSSGEIGSIKLAWDLSTDTNLAGYKVYYGTSPGKYSSGIAVGNVTTYVLTGLIKGQKYYLAITAYDKAGKESRFSTEIFGMAE
jgi:hypothetical protein